MTTESTLTASIVREIVRCWPSCWYFKVHGSPYQRAGVPDLLLCVEGRFIGLEVKHPKPGESEDHARSRATVRQRKQISDIIAAGGYAAVVVSVEEAVAAVEQALRM